MGQIMSVQYNLWCAYLRDNNQARIERTPHFCMDIDFSSIVSPNIFAGHLILLPHPPQHFHILT